MKWMMIGIAAIAVPLIGLQGMAVHKSEENYGKAVFDTVELYKAEPLNVGGYIKKAVRICLEARAETELPDYFTTHIYRTIKMGIAFAAENDINSTDDPAVQAFIEGESDRLRSKADALADRIAKEPPQRQEAMNRALDWMASDRKSMARCFGPKVVKMAKAH